MIIVAYVYEKTDILYFFYIKNIKLMYSKTNITQSNN